MRDDAEDRRFALKRVTSKKRLRAKLREVKTELMRRRHDPIPDQGRWLASVVRGHSNYYAVPGNIDAVAAFHNQAAGTGIGRFGAAASAPV